MKKYILSFITSLFVIINIFSICDNNVIMNNSDFPHYPISIYSDDTNHKNFIN